jgi:putative oxidoreductase
VTELESTAYFLARVLSCGIWVAAGCYKVTHYDQTVEEMVQKGVPLPRLVLPFVIALDFVGSGMVILDYYTWAVALAWIAFTVAASLIYHVPYLVREGTIDFVEFLLFWKNISICGGLLALVLLDRTRPSWLFGGG